MEPSTQNPSPAIPVAIVCGFAMIALAIFLTNKNSSDNEPAVAVQPVIQESSNGFRPVDETDYILGNPNAPILMVEYSDYDCPFCKQYHSTLHQIMDDFGVSGKVAWVYRQFPLAQLHPNSPKISEAALCVGEIGGQDAFWKFSDMIFDERHIDEQTNITKLLSYAVNSGVDSADYLSCVNGGKMKEKVLSSTAEAFEIGARGTPYTVVIVGDQQAVIDGAQPHDVVRSIIRSLVNQIENKEELPPSSTTVN